MHGNRRGRVYPAQASLPGRACDAIPGEVAEAAVVKKKNKKLGTGESFQSSRQGAIYGAISNALRTFFEQPLGVGLAE